MSEMPTDDTPIEDLPIEIVRSSRRKKTAQALVRGGRLRVMLPAGMDRDEEARVVDQLVEQVSRKSARRSTDLAERARAVAARYGLNEPASVEWSDRQNIRWGSCTPANGSIRISHRLQGAPGWVLDGVLVHELAHLDERGHGPAFQALVSRYPLVERVIGYLIAKSEG